MHLGICNLSVIPLRASNNHRSEMVSQVLFAEQFEILREEKEWAHIRMQDIGYEGWVQQGQFLHLPETQSMDSSDDGYAVVDIDGGTALFERYKVDLVVGTKIPLWLMQQQDTVFPCQLHGSFRTPHTADFKTEFPKLLDYYHHCPYLWGGRTHFGIDCSGLSQAVYAHFGIQLPRDAYQQVEGGEVVNFPTAIQPGDLAFFDNEEGRIVHVGIMIDTETIFHASANVRIDKMDAAGIFHQEQNRYTHKLRIVKRFL